MGKKKILSIVLASVALLAIISVAIIAGIIEGGNLPGENVSWTIDEETKTLYINGTGEMEAVYTTIKNDASKSTLYHGAPWTQSQYRDKFDKAVIGEGITNIDRWAFLGLEKLVSVEIPTSVTVIEGQAFSGCSSLTTVNLPEGLKVIEEHVFYNCKALQSIEIPSSVTEIKSSAFEGSGLVSISIPANVKKINFAAFADSASLATVTLNEGLEVIDANAFENTAITSFTVPASVKTLGERFVANTNSLATLTVASANEKYTASGNVVLTKDGKTIVASANAGVSGAYSVPAGVTKIGNGAFMGNTNITGITFNGAAEVGMSAFMNCTGITALEIPATVTTVKAMAFQGCTGMASLTLNEGITKLGKHAFDGCSALTSASIPASVGIVDDYLFANCDLLGTVTMAEGISSVGYRAFNECEALTTVNFASTVTLIGSGAFDGCSTLESVELPKALETLGTDAFVNCESLANISVAAGSENYSSDGRAIYGNNGTLLQIYFVANPATDYTPLATTITIAANAFEGATYLQSIDFSQATSIRTINSMAFKGCTALESIDFPATVKTVGDSAFEGCSALTSVGFAEAIEGDTETCTFGASMFKGCDNLESVVVPEGVTSLEGGTFENCTKLVTVELPSTLKSIGANLFYNCTSLKNAKLPDGIFTIQSGTFYNCSSLEEFHIPENIGMFYADAFTGCVNMKKVYVTLEGWKNYCKSNTGNVLADSVGLPLNWCEELYIDGVLTEDITIYAESLVPDKHGEVYIPGYILRGFKGMKTLTIEEGAYDDGVKMDDGIGVTRISSFTFAECTNLEKVTFPSTLRTIGARNFLDCKNLKEVNFDNITSVGINAFDGCTSLRAVNAPNLTTVSGSAFANCTNLKVVNLPKVTQIDKYAFSKCSNIVSLRIGPDLATYDASNNPFDRANVYVELVNESSKTIAVANTPWYTEAGHVTETADGFWFAENPTSGTNYLLGYFGDAELAQIVYLPKLGNSKGYNIYNGAFANYLDINSLVIPSEVNAIGTGVFTGSDVTALYASTATATKLNLLANYPSIDIYPYTPLSIATAALQLGNNFAIEYRINSNALDGFTEFGVTFELDGKATTVTDYKIVDGVYIFTFKNIAPHMMNETITATAFATDAGGKQFNGYSREYSVVQYCINQLAKGTEKTEFSTLLVDVLNYGAATQAYLISEGTEGINATLANSELSADQLAWGSAETAPAKTNSFKYTTKIDSPSVTWTGVALELQNSITMRFKFKTEKDISTLTFKAKRPNGKEIVLTEVEATGNANEYYLYFKGLNAAMMSDIFEFTVYEGDTAISHTFSYSVESYVVGKQAGGDELANLVVAMFNYGNATKAYITE